MVKDNGSATLTANDRVLDGPPITDKANCLDHCRGVLSESVTDGDIRLD